MNNDEMAEELAGFNMAHTRIHSRADELISCLEGEIAKRDEELAACRVAVENCEVFRARIAELEDDFKCAHSMLCEVSKSGMVLRAELAAIKAQEPVAWYTEDHLDDKSATTYSWTVAERWVEKGWPASPLYAAPVSDAKAQGVVIPRNIEKSFLEWASAQLKAPTQLAAYMAGADEVARLNAAPVQQVSVPASAFASRAITHYEAALLAAFPSGSSGEVFNQWNEARRVLAAAPAAPAADSGLDYQALFDAIAAATSVYANGAVNISVQAFRESLAAHSAEGVV